MNNNRRRGRNNNNNNRQQNNNRSGFDYLNQIDNKARGNASQMLEKYKKLASDAQLNGDRVTAESYHQFADHYFRVLADFRSRQEARQGETQNRQPRSEWQNDEGRDDARDDGRESSFSEQDGSLSESSFESEAAETGEDVRSETEERTARPRRNDRPDRNRQPRRHHSEEPRDDEGENMHGGLDLAVLPPAISASNDFEEETPAKAPRKPRARRPKSANDEEVVTAAE